MFNVSRGNKMDVRQMKPISLRSAGLVFLLLVIVSYAGHSLAQLESTSLQIMSPVDGAIVSPGQNVSIIVQVADGTSFDIIQVLGEDLGMSLPKADPPFEFTLVVPNRIIGPKKIRALGKSDGSFVFSAPVTIHIEPAATLTELNVSPTGILFEAQGDDQPIRVIGTFDDGSILTITKSLQTSFTSNDPSVATVDSAGLVTAVGSAPPGIAELTTEIVVTYGSQSVVVPVTLRLSDNVTGSRR